MWVCFEAEARFNRLCEPDELCEDIVFVAEARLKRRKKIVVFCVPVKTVIEHTFKDFGNAREKRDGSIGSWVRFFFPRFVNGMNDGKFPF